MAEDFAIADQPAEGMPLWIASAHRMLAEKTPVGFAILDADLRYVLVNPVLAEINGVPPDQHYGRTPRDVAPDLADAAMEPFQRVLATGEPLMNLELTGTVPSAPDQARHWLENVYPLPGPDGAFVGITVMIREITHLRLAQRALTAQKAAEAHAQRLALLQRLTAALSSASDTIEVARAVTATATEAFDTTTSFVASMEARQPRILAFTGPPHTLPVGWLEHPIATPIREVLRPGGVAVVWESREERNRRYPSLAKDTDGFEAGILASLLVASRPVGLAAFGWHHAREVTPDDVDLLVAVAAQTASALDRARLFDAERHALDAARRGQRRLELLAEVSAQLAEAVSEAEQLDRLADGLTTSGFADWVVVCLPSDDGVLYRRVLGASEPALRSLVKGFINTPIAADDPGTAVWLTGQSALIPMPDPGSFARDTGVNADLIAGVRTIAGGGSFLAVPLASRSQRLGIVIAWRKYDSGLFGPDDLRLLEDVGRRAGVAVDNLRLLEAEHRVAVAWMAQRRLELLAEVSTQLAEAAGEVEQVDRLADVLVTSGFVGWCTVLLPDDNGKLLSRAVRAADPDRMPLQEVFQDIGSSDGDPWCVAWRSGQSVFVPTSGPVMHPSGPSGDITSQADKAGGTGSAIAVPLEARGQRLGVLVVWRGHEHGPFSPDDQEMLEDVGRRAGMAIDNLRLLAERTYVAARLQETLLPDRLPTIHGTELAAGYLVAEACADVGGDFYDVFGVDDGYVLVIGDVAGRGVDAAGMTGVARATLRALAGHLPPSEILKRLNTLLAERNGRESFLTLAYLMLSPDINGATLRIWLAGHPPPLLVQHNGTTVELGIPGPLLGIFTSVIHTESTYHLTSGDLLLLYTDGLYEARGPEGLFGESRLPALLPRLAGSTAADAVTQLEQAVTDYRADTGIDDTAILAIRLTLPTETVEQILVDHHLPATKAAVHQTLRIVDEAVTPLVAPQPSDQILDVVRDVLTHVLLRYAEQPSRSPRRDPLSLRVIARGRTLRVEVHVPVSHSALSTMSEGLPEDLCQGLFAASVVVSDWGVTTSTGMTCVWFEVNEDQALTQPERQVSHRVG